MPGLGLPSHGKVPGIGPLLLAAHAVLEDDPVIELAGAMNVVRWRVAALASPPP